VHHHHHHHHHKTEPTWNQDVHYPLLGVNLRNVFLEDRRDHHYPLWYCRVQSTESSVFLAHLLYDNLDARVPEK
jgi:hypothetical protein